LTFMKLGRAPATQIARTSSPYRCSTVGPLMR